MCSTLTVGLGNEASSMRRSCSSSLGRASAIPTIAHQSACGSLIEIRRFTSRDTSTGWALPRQRCRWLRTVLLSLPSKMAVGRQRCLLHTRLMSAKRSRQRRTGNGSDGIGLAKSRSAQPQPGKPVRRRKVLGHRFEVPLRLPTTSRIRLLHSDTQPSARRLIALGHRRSLRLREDTDYGCNGPSRGSMWRRGTR